MNIYNLHSNPGALYGYNNKENVPVVTVDLFHQQINSALDNFRDNYPRYQDFVESAMKTFYKIVDQSSGDVMMMLDAIQLITDIQHETNVEMEYIMPMRNRLKDVIVQMDNPSLAYDYFVAFEANDKEILGLIKRDEKTDELYQSWWGWENDAEY